MHKKTTGVPTPKTPRTPPAKIKQKHGGALNAGGTPGNAGGRRTPKDELAWVRKMALSTRMRRSLREIARRGQHRDKLTLWKMLTDRAFGAPNQKHEVKTTLAALLGEDEGTAV